VILLLSLIWRKLRKSVHASETKRYLFEIYIYHSLISIKIH
jgi:hypothetical protein